MNRRDFAKTVGLGMIALGFETTASVVSSQPLTEFLVLK